MYSYHPLCVSRGTEEPCSHGWLHTQTHWQAQAHTCTHPSQHLQARGNRARSWDSTVIPHLLSLAGAEALLQHYLSSHLPSFSLISLCLSIWSWFLLNHFKKLLFFLFQKLPMGMFLWPNMVKKWILFPTCFQPCDSILGVQMFLCMKIVSERHWFPNYSLHFVSNFWTGHGNTKESAWSWIHQRYADIYCLGLQIAALQLSRHFSQKFTWKVF